MKISQSSQLSIDTIAAAFAALGQPSRLKIVRLLLSAYPKGLPAGEIQKELSIAAPTLSHHLDKLRQVGYRHCRERPSVDLVQRPLRSLEIVNRLFVRRMLHP